MSQKSEADNLISIKGAYVKQEDRVLDPTKLPKETLGRLPNPTGWRLLILPYAGKGRTEGGVFLPDSVVE